MRNRDLSFFFGILHTALLLQSENEKFYNFTICKADANGNNPIAPVPVRGARNEVSYVQKICTEAVKTVDKTGIL